MKNDGLNVPSGIYHLGAQAEEQKLVSGCVKSRWLKAEHSNAFLDGSLKRRAAYKFWPFPSIQVSD